MMKISIKREQSQAGLSFAERLRVGEPCSGMRENRRSLAGGESKFRPQVKNKLFLLLALLLTAATGAWATTPNSIVINGTPLVGDKSISLTYHFDPNNVPGLESFAPTLKVKCAADNKWDEVWLSLTEISSGTTNISLSTLGEFEAGKTYEVCFAYNNGNWVDEVFQTFVPATAASSAPKHLIKATYRERTRSLEQPLPYATTIGELFEAVTGEHFSDLISTMSSMEMPLTGISSNNTSAVSIGELNGASTPVTVIADGKATISINFGSYAYGIFVSAISPLYAYMKDGVKDADKWTVKVGDGQAQALPIGGLKGDGSETVTLQYTGRLKVKGVKATSDEAPAAPAGNSVDLSTLTADYEAKDGETLTGTLASNVKISIADGATVTLKDVNITNLGNDCNWAGINCPGDATLVLEGTNTVCAGRASDGYNNYPGIWIAPDKTLTIQGDGTLTAYSNDINPWGAGIGGGYQINCGNIVISGGNITATGGKYGTGIGGGRNGSCGNITISGGTVTAAGGESAAGIGGGRLNGDCGNITITSGVTSVTATKGEGAPNSIGAGLSGADITVNIGGVEGAITTSPYTYDPAAPAKTPATVTAAPTGAAVVGVGKTTALVSGGAAEGGTLMYKVTTENTKPASTDGFSDAVPTAQTITASGKVYVWYYVKGDDTHSDSEIAATAIEVPVAEVITWNSSNVSDLRVTGTHGYEKEGVTLNTNAEMNEARWRDKGDQSGIYFEAMETGGFTFTAPTVKAFAKIEMNAQGPEGWDITNLGTGWAINNTTITWTGSAASTVGLLTDAGNFNGMPVNSIVFYLVDAE